MCSIRLFRIKGSAAAFVDKSLSCQRSIYYLRKEADDCKVIGMRQRAYISTLLLAISIASCIFQNDPLEPNNPPAIDFFWPEETDLDYEVPDSCVFYIEASDTDGDQLDYIFLIGDSVLSVVDTVLFRASVGGEFELEGRVSDGSGCTSNIWTLHVSTIENDPPVIKSYLPLRKNIACTVGDTLEFRFSADDDHPLDLSYLYKLTSLDDLSAQTFSGSSILIHRFMERGDFTLDGIAWDGQFGDTTSWNVAVTGFPDTISPSAIIDLEGWTGEELGTVVLEWTAPGDDSTYGTAARYEVRTSTRPILTEEEWDRASRKNDAPEPSPAGTRETMVVRYLNPGTYLYLTMRAIDDFSRWSPIGNCIWLHVRGVDAEGYVIDLYTGEGMGGLFVTSEGIATTTDDSGHYLLQNIPYYATSIRATDNLAGVSIGEYYDCVLPLHDLSSNVSVSFHVIPVLGMFNVVEPDQYENRFLLFFKEVTETSGRFGAPTVYKSWRYWPLTVYNPPMVYEDLDLQAAARGAMTEWEDMTGLDLFQETDEATGANVMIVYNDSLTYKHRYATTGYNSDGSPARREIQIYLRYSGVPMNRFAHLVFAHELGHVLCFAAHSYNLGHLMLGLTMPKVHHVTTDEANVVRIVYHAPHIFDFGIIFEE